MRSFLLFGPGENTESELGIHKLLGNFVTNMSYLVVTCSIKRKATS